MKVRSRAVHSFEQKTKRAVGTARKRLSDGQQDAALLRDHGDRTPNRIAGLPAKKDKPMERAAVPCFPVKQAKLEIRVLPYCPQKAIQEAD